MTKTTEPTIVNILSNFKEVKRVNFLKGKGGIPTSLKIVPGKNAVDSQDFAAAMKLPHFKAWVKDGQILDAEKFKKAQDESAEAFMKKYGKKEEAKTPAKDPELTAEERAAKIKASVDKLVAAGNENPTVKEIGDDSGLKVTGEEKKAALATEQ